MRGMSIISSRLSLLDALMTRYPHFDAAQFGVVVAPRDEVNQKREHVIYLTLTLSELL